MMFKFWIMELLAKPLVEKILAFHYLMHVGLTQKPLKLSFLRVLCVSVVRSSMTRA